MVTSIPQTRTKLEEARFFLSQRRHRLVIQRLLRGTQRPHTAPQRGRARRVVVAGELDA